MLSFNRSTLALLPVHETWQFCPITTDEHDPRSRPTWITNKTTLIIIIRAKCNQALANKTCIICYLLLKQYNSLLDSFRHVIRSIKQSTFVPSNWRDLSFKNYDISPVRSGSRRDFSEYCRENLQRKVEICFLYSISNIFFIFEELNCEEGQLMKIFQEYIHELVKFEISKTEIYFHTPFLRIKFSRFLKNAI